MVDAEFAVQHLILCHAGRYTGLLANVGNIALLHRAEQEGLLPAGVGAAAADAYRDLRRAQHKARLDEQSTQFPQKQFAPQAQAISALWRSVLT
jgi:glutamate-ammonia-ligase adenylyltransferase